jgi:hypothetical protein
MVEFIKTMYDDTQFCVKWNYEEVTASVKQDIRLIQGCSLSPYLLNMFIDDIIEYISEEVRMHQ